MSDAIREAFESSYRDTHGIDIPELAFSKDDEGEYHDPDIGYEWLVWESGYRAALQSQTAPAVPDDWLKELAEEWRTYEHNNANAADNHKSRGEVSESETSWNRAIVFAQCASALESALSAAPQPDHSPDAGKVVDDLPGMLDQPDLSGGETDCAPDAGKYEIRADGKRVRKDRWEAGFRSIVTCTVGPRTEFEIDDIVELVRQKFAPAADGEEVETCPECGSDKLEWITGTHYPADVPDGRGRTSEARTIFGLGCTECSETVRTIDTDAACEILNARSVKQPTCNNGQSCEHCEPPHGCRHSGGGEVVQAGAILAAVDYAKSRSAVNRGRGAVSESLIFEYALSLLENTERVFSTREELVKRLRSNGGDDSE